MGHKIILILLLFLYNSDVLASTSFIKGKLSGGKSISSDYYQNKIMFIGDSLTRSLTFRDTFQDLIGVTNNIDYVGPYTNSGVAPYDDHMCALGGYISTGIEPLVLSGGACDANLYLTSVGGGAKSAVFIHLGTNDMDQSSVAVYVANTALGMTSMLNMINYIDSIDTRIPIYVGLIIPTTTGAKDTQFTYWNSELSSTITTRQATKSNLYLVDFNTEFKSDTSGYIATDCSSDWTTCMADNLHPNATGYAVMSKILRDAYATHYNTTTLGSLPYP